MKQLTQLQRVEQARMSLVLDFPLFGVLAMNLRLEETTRVQTCATDGTRLYFNPKYTAQHDDLELQFAVAHEVGHNMLGHPFRSEGREPNEWNICCDYALNPLLVSELARLKAPKSILLDAQYIGLSAEQIAARRWRDQQKQQQQEQKDNEQDNDKQPEDDAPGGDAESDEQQPGDEQDGGQDAPDDDDTDDSEGDAGGDGGAGSEDGEQEDAPSTSGSDAEGDADEPTLGGEAPPDEQWGHVVPAPEPEDGDEPSTDDTPKPMTELDWQIAVEQAISYVAKAGTVSADLAREVERTREAEIDWKEALRRFVEQTIVSDTSWTRPNRRFIASGLYLPGALRENTPRLGVVIDTSGSIPPQMLNQGAAEVTAIVQQVRPAAVDVLYVDTAVCNVQTFTPDDAEITFEPRGGGGTYFQPAFDWFANADEPVAGIIFFTDTYCSDQPQEPDVPVLFIVPEFVGRDGPFGETVRMPIIERR